VLPQCVLKCYPTLRESSQARPMEEARARSALASPRRSIESPHSWPASFNEELDRLALALGHAARVGDESEEDDDLDWGLAAADGKARDEEADVLLDDGDGGCEAGAPLAGQVCSGSRRAWS